MPLQGKLPEVFPIALGTLVGLGLQVNRIFVIDLHLKAKQPLATNVTSIHLAQLSMVVVQVPFQAFLGHEGPFANWAQFILPFGPWRDHLAVDKVRNGLKFLVWMVLFDVLLE